ncbi:unnamed protein product [Owenia fusiformis]|uniref:Uncharacterized protein n=1 Tax=Owenia fusiformis TaxID=6347 RepID=A0A8J1UH90_OWEFU|nr:unnamed protein product [Owenia fusiformis]
MSSPGFGLKIGLDTWLKTLGLEEYIETFKEFDSLQEVLPLTEKQLKELGINNGAARAKMVSSLNILNEKLKKRDTMRQSTALASHNSDYDFRNISQDKLRKDLGTELSMDSSHMCSFAWFHGSIPRQKAENLLQKQGDFLIRESSSNPGDYVLTCKWQGNKLHFMVNKQVYNINTPYMSVQYQFEDDLFDSVPALINFYVANRKIVSSSSGAIIAQPLNRSVPLSYYDKNYASLCSEEAGGNYSTLKNSPKSSPHRTPTSTPPMNRKIPTRSGSQPLLSIDEDFQNRHMSRHGSLPMISQQQTSSENSNSNNQSKSLTHHYRSGSEPNLNPGTMGMNIVNKPVSNLKTTNCGSDSELTKPAPPKPSRVPSIKITATRPRVQVRNKALYDIEYEQQDYTQYESVKTFPKDLTPSKAAPLSKTYKQPSEPPGESDYDNNFGAKIEYEDETDDYDVPKSPNKIIITESKMSVKDLERQDSGMDYDEIDEEDIYDTPPSPKFTIPSLKSPSKLQLSTFKSTLLPPNNKPLEGPVLLKTRQMLLSKSPGVLSGHITYQDSHLLSLWGEDLGVGVRSGLELFTLPQGSQLRVDIIERHNCLKLFVTVTILMASNLEERVQILKQWIDVATHLHSADGNLFAFTSVLEALGLIPITRLRRTWQKFQERHPKSSATFQNHLLPAYVSNNQGVSSTALQNTSVPHILPLAQLLERILDPKLPLLPWEQQNENYGIDVLLAHLNGARSITEHCGLYKIKSALVINSLENDQSLLDIFDANFHLKFLWGSKGASVNAKDRYAKFDQLLTVLSERAEQSQAQGPNQETAF